MKEPGWLLRELKQLPWELIRALRELVGPARELEGTARLL